MHPQSIYGKRVIKAGLNLETTSILGLGCVENGIPYDFSFIALATKKAGMKNISIAEIERRFGQNWTREICC